MPRDTTQRQNNNIKNTTVEVLNFEQNTTASTIPLHPFFLFPLTEKHRHGPPTATRKGKRNDDHSRCAMSELHTSWNVKTTCSSKSEMCYSPHSITISNTTSSPLLRHSRISVGTTPSLTVNVRRKASVAQQCGGYLWWHDSIVNLVSCKSTTS